jgi:hypothetical protein
MKRWLQFVVALTFSVIVATSASAQEDASPWRLGIQAGASYSNLNGDVLASSDATWGPLAGGTAEYFFANSFSIELEANYVQRGNKKGQIGNTEFEMDLKYVELPLILNGYYAFNENWHGSLYAGLALALKVACDVRIDDDPQSDCSQASITGEAESISWGVPVGGGVVYKFPGKNSLIRLDVRYSIGLSDVVKNLDITTRAWEFILGYGFGL